MIRFISISDFTKWVNKAKIKVLLIACSPYRKMPKAIITNLDSIPVLAKNIAKGLKGGEIFALVGTLGSGKTTFVKALGRELKIKHNITSPTFTLMNFFSIKLKGKPIFIYHLDLYRTKTFKEIKALGLTEFWGQTQTITLIEWADKIYRHLPKKTKIIKFLN